MKILKLLFISFVFVLFVFNKANARNVDYGVLAFLNWNHSWNAKKYSNDYQLKKAIKQIKKLGVEIVRVDFPWSDIEQKENAYFYNRYDNIVELLNKNDIEILAVVGYSPSWAANSWNSPPHNKQAMVRFISNLAYRYKGKIRYWEFWNEPDSRVYFSKQDGMKTYTSLLKTFYVTIKNIIPDSQILHGGVTTSGYYAIKNILRHGGGHYFDIANIHPFVDPGREGFENELSNKIIALKKLLVANGKDARIWITEIGCPGLAKHEYGQTWWNGNGQTETEQAVFLDKAVRFLSKQDGVEKIFWAFFKDNEAHFHDAVDNFGLVRQDGSYKPSFKTFKRIIAEE